MGAACCKNDGSGQVTTVGTLTAQSETPEQAPDTPEPDEEEIQPAPEPAEVGNWGEFNLVVTKQQDSDKIGASVSKEADCVIILKVKDGLLKDYNDSCPVIKIEPDDEIIRVNGVKGDNNAMLKEMGVSSTLELRIRRLRKQEN